MTIALFCVTCGCIVLFRWVRDRIGKGGETWEVYRCEECGSDKEFCTK